MKPFRYFTDGLGGCFGVSCSLDLGTKKSVSFRKTHLLLISLLCFNVLKPSHDFVPLFCLLTHIQHCNEVYRNIRHPRKICLSYKNKYFTYYCFTSLIFIVLHVWLFMLILLSGDVEVNPGPDSVESSTDFSDILSSASLNSLSNHLSILHLNIQSLLPKIDLIRGEAIAHDILIFTESWLKPTINDDSIHIENFLPPFRTDRWERPGGGVIAYVRDTLSCKWRTYLEIRGVEGLWLEINIKAKKILVGDFIDHQTATQTIST